MSGAHMSDEMPGPCRQPRLKALRQGTQEKAQQLGQVRC